MYLQKLIAGMLACAMLITGCGSFGAASIAPKSLASSMAQDVVPKSAAKMPGLSLRVPFGGVVPKDTNPPAATYYASFAPGDDRVDGVLEGDEEDEERIQWGSNKSPEEIQRENDRLNPRENPTAQEIYELTEEAKARQRESEVLSEIARQSRERQQQSEAIERMTQAPAGGWDAVSFFIVIGAIALATAVALEDEEEEENSY